LGTRSYSSALRDAQVEQTRSLLMERARALLIDGGPQALTLPKLAQAAGVSAPTVYRHFPTLDDLLRAFLDWLRPRLGLTAERLSALTPEQMPSVPLENFPRYEAEAPILLPLMESREFNRVRVGNVRERARNAAKQMRAGAPGWSNAQLEAMIGTVWVLNSPQAWRWLRDTWGLENDEAARAASWATRTLLEALAQGPKLSERRSSRPARRRRR
jgi:AcrR family transcriptional regulator